MVQPAGLLHILVRHRFLTAELIAGETKNDQPLILILLMQILQSLELWGKPALGGSIDDKYNFTFISGHADRLPLRGIHTQFVKLLGHN